MADFSLLMNYYNNGTQFNVEITKIIAITKYGIVDVERRRKKVTQTFDKNGKKKKCSNEKCSRTESNDDF